MNGNIRSVENASPIPIHTSFTFQVRTKLQNVHKKELEDLSKWIKVW